MRISQRLFVQQCLGKVAMSSCHDRQLRGSFVVDWPGDSHAALEHTLEALVLVALKCTEKHLKCEVGANISCRLPDICSVD